MKLINLKKKLKYDVHRKADPTLIEELNSACM